MLSVVIANSDIAQVYLRQIFRSCQDLNIEVSACQTNFLMLIHQLMTNVISNFSNHYFRYRTKSEVRFSDFVKIKVSTFQIAHLLIDFFQNSYH